MFISSRMDLKPMRTPRVPARGLFLCGQMKRDRVISLIDGFNLYHAIARLKQPHLNLVDLKNLSQLFIKPISEELTQIFYFSALSIHTSEENQKLQKAYINAQTLRGIKVILGQFKKKNRYCSLCSSHSISHEEKETDVNIALALFELAYTDVYDRAFLITNDSDQAPAIQKVLEHFPHKKITIVTPPLSRQCNELIQVASDRTKITVHHLERCLLPEVIKDSTVLI
jgi:uncharacterized LabA/DUF88 family protein